MIKLIRVVRDACILLKCFTTNHMVSGLHPSSAKLSIRMKVVVAFL